MRHPLDAVLDPRSVAVIGASTDPDKVGGRPIAYLRRFGYRGTVYPVNPRRSEVQGLPTVASPDQIDGPLDVALVAVPGAAAVDAVRASAAAGASVAIVMTAGFGETGTEEGVAAQREMLAAARATGMRVIGPNSQGLANFGTGAVLGFSTMFIEQPPADGPVAVISQSGAMSSVPYGLLRARGIGVRHSHATGNDADVTVGELAEAVAADPEVRLLLLYLENLSDPAALARAAEVARARDLPVVALMGGRSADGQRAAKSHTGALATEQAVVDAYFEQLGIRRARSMPDMIDTVELYLRGWSPSGRRLVVVSNSGAVCVLAADAAADVSMPLATLSPDTERRVADVLPGFATSVNPIDITAALLTDSGLFGRVLPVVADDPAADAFLLGIPVAGKGYDVPRFGTDAATFAARTGKPLVVAAPQPSVADEFRRHDLVVYPDETTAIRALDGYLGHHELLARTPAGAPAAVAATLAAVHRPDRPAKTPDDAAGRPADTLDETAGRPADTPDDTASRSADTLDETAGRPADTPDDTAGRPADTPDDTASRSADTLDEATSLARLAAAGVPVVAHRLCHSPEEAVAAAESFGGGPVVVKGCSADAPHKSELGLVELGVRGASSVAEAYRRMAARMAELGLGASGVIVAEQTDGGHDMLVGAHLDPLFGPVVVVGAGGRYVEALPDAQVLLAPVDRERAERAIRALRIAPVLAGVRGEPPADIAALADVTVRIGELMLAGNLASVDANPVRLTPTGATTLDALLLTT